MLKAQFWFLLSLLSLSISYLPVVVGVGRAEGAAAPPGLGGELESSGGRRSAAADCARSTSC